MANFPSRPNGLFAEAKIPLPRGVSHLHARVRDAARREVFPSAPKPRWARRWNYATYANEYLGCYNKMVESFRLVLESLSFSAVEKKRFWMDESVASRALM